MVNRTYTRSFASLATILVAFCFSFLSAVDLWVLRQSTIPSLEALKPLPPEHTWRFIQPMLAKGANEKFVEERISSLVSDSTILQEGWKKYVEAKADRARWELAAWLAVLVCSLALFAFRKDAIDE